MSPPPDLGTLRGRMAEATDGAVAAHARLAAARSAIERIRQTGLGDLAQAEADLQAASGASQASAVAVEGVRSDLRDALITHVGTVTTAAPVAPAEVPVALLPVGIETRFQGDTLLIRVIPDEFHVEDHEPELTDGEVDVGRTFWVQVWRGGTEEPAATEAEQLAWTRLVAAVGSSRRAAWVADRTAPNPQGRPAAAVPDDQPLADPALPDSPFPGPAFPDPPRRAAAWSRAAMARTLPDQFVAIAYRRQGSGGQTTWNEIGRATGGPVDDAVQLGFDPAAPPPAVTDDGPALPDGMRWMVDVAAAERVGLLLRLTLPPGTTTVDRLVVLGVLGSLDPEASADRLADLLVGHHHTRGLEMLPIGAPTNNTAAERSAHRSTDDPVGSFTVERRTPRPPAGSDGGLLARALGLPVDTLRGVARSNDTEQAAAGEMNALIWPAAFGYWLESLVQPGPGDAIIADLRRHAVQMVRGRGPLPPLRVGRQPYGVLPVTSLQRWQPSHEPAGLVQAVGFLRSALPWWLDGISEAPIVRAGADPDQGMLDVLAQVPVSSTVGVRSMVGANACYTPFGFLLGDTGNKAADEANRQRWMALLGFRALGVTGFPYLGQLVGKADPVPLLRLPYAVDPRLSPANAAVAWAAIGDYLRGLRGRRTASLQAEDPRSFTSLLTLLAHRSVMLERLRTGVADSKGSIAGRLVEAHLRVDDPAVVQAAMISTTATLRIGETRSNAAALLAGSIEQPDGSALGLIDHLDRELVSGAIDVVRHPGYVDTVHAAEAVADLPPDRAALLLGEALDVASHRFDAWITSVATRRLSDLRATTPSGVTIGAYAAVEDLIRRPARAAVADPPDGAPTPLVQDVAGGGYIHAPSLAQAATAAVLRAGHLAHAARDPHAGALAVDLSSSRVRTALGLLDGVRQGQSLGALLGYRAERLLHERGAHTAVEVVRRLAPPPMVTAPGTPEGLPPRSVCDGLALSRLERSAVLAAVAGADAADGADRTTVNAVLDELAEAVDAVADLLLAEGVHQIVRGNPDRAAAALDTLNRGEGAMAEPEVVRTPRTGTSITNRVLVTMGAQVVAASGWPTDGVRAATEPRVAAWAGHLLGDPTNLAVRLHAAEAPHAGEAAEAPGDNPPSAATVTMLTLQQVGVGALDLVYEPLAPRVLRHARTLGLGDVSVDLEEPAMASVLATAELIHGVLSRARAGTGLDLVRPQDRGGVVIGPPPAGGIGSEAGPLETTLPDVDRGNRRARLDGARARLQSAVARLAGIDVTAPPPAESSLVEALDTLAAFGVAPGGDPAQAPSATALLALHDAGQARLAASEASPDDPAALFGEGFPVLSLAAPPFAAPLTAALGSDPLAAAPANVLAPLGGAGAALVSWLETHGRVRPGVGRLADLLLAARLRGTQGPAGLRAVQLPVEPFPGADPARRRQWVGLPFPAALGPDPVTSLVVHALGDIDPTEGTAVLVVDEFVEVVPAAETTTAVSFGFDAPGARPPQSILLAVPPVADAPWTIDALAEVIGETLDLAKIRMVDLSAVAWAGRFVPTIYLTDGDVASGLDLPMRDLVKQAHLHAEVFRP